MKTVYLNASYFPAVELLAAVATAVILALRRQPGDRRGDPDRRHRRLRRLPDRPSSNRSSSSPSSTRPTSRGWRRWTRSSTCSTPRPTWSTPPDAIDPGDAARRDRDGGRLVLLRASDGRERARAERRSWALRDVDLHVPPGQTLALVGATGAGKSTFAKLVARFYDPQQGTVLVDGHDLRGVQQRALRRQLGIVPQEGFLFSGSVRENIAFGRPEASLEEIEAAVADGRRDRVRRRPAGRDRDRGRRARRPALRRPAPARRLRPRPARRAAHPDPRRGHLQRRRPHREDDRERPRAPAPGPHRDRHRPPPLDDPPRRQDRRPRRRPDRRAGHPRRADRGRRPLRQALRRLG